MTVKLDLTISGAKTMLRVLDYVISQADSNHHVAQDVDRLCRKDSAQRWRELRNYVNGRLPKRHRFA